MAIAIKEAQQAFEDEEVPVGCVIVDANNQFVSSAHNLKETSQCATQHAEIIAIEAANEKLQNWRLSECSVYITLEPCMMCTGALLQSRVKNVFYGAAEPKFGCLKSCLDINQLKNSNHQFTQIENLEITECRELITEFFRRRR